MARPDLFMNRKFFLLSKRLGSRMLAAGALECVWSVGYSSGEPNVGGPEEVEAICEWKGEPGALCAALVDAGFLDPSEGESLSIHDLYDHAPSYVQKRMKAEVSRREAGKTISDLRRAAANVRWEKTKGEQAGSGGKQTDANEFRLNANDAPPAPAPAPAPLEEKSAALALPPEVSPTLPGVDVVEEKAPSTKTKAERPDEERWVEYARRTWPGWPDADIRGAWAHYQARGWRGITDWRAAAKTCAHRSAARPVNGSRRSIVQPSFQNEGLVGPAKYADVPVKEV